MPVLLKTRLAETVIGRRLAENIYDSLGILLGRKGEFITNALLSDLAEAEIAEISILEDESGQAVEKNGFADPEAAQIDFEKIDRKIDKIFALVAQYDEIQQMSAMIKRIIREMPSNFIFSSR
ncbi:hypothetical protein TRIP_C20026 [Candidatus Zixiibacteriota bacterium]|nr:hypothetical protein TRIP_C20026 [candidate division Zixibacteria bacterium]